MDAPLENECPGIKPRRPRPGAAVSVARRRRGPRLPGKIVDVYLFGSVLEATWRGITWFGGLLFAFAVITAVRKFVESSLSFSGMLLLLIYQMPRIFLFALPMSLLFGTLQTFADLSFRGEIIALGVGGMSLPRMLRAPLLAGLLLTILSFFVQEALVPGAETRYDDLLERKALESLAAQKTFSYQDPPRGMGELKRSITAKRFDPVNKVLYQPRIQLFDEMHRPNMLMEAKEVHWDSLNKGWEFTDGYVDYITYRKGLPKHNLLQFSSATNKEIKGIDKALPSPEGLNSATKDLREHMQHKDFELYSIAEMWQFLQSLASEKPKNNSESRELRKLKASVTYGMHDKIATPLICIALVLAGVPLGLRPQRTTGGVAFGLSLGVLLLYYVVWSWAGTIGSAGAMDPVLMAYMPLALTAIVGLLLVWKKSR